MKHLNKKINITVEKTDTGYSAYTLDMNVFTTGKDISDLHDNLLEALNFAYQDLEKSKSQGDWWDELSTNQQKMIQTGLADIDNGNVISSAQFWEELRSI